MTLRAQTSIWKVLVFTALAAAVSVGILQAQDVGRGSAPQATPQVQAPMGRGQMGMMAERQKMMAEMNAGQKKLDDLVARMNAATGQAKVDQMAAVISELVAQRRTMQGQMMSMQGDMMKQMMQMMQPGQPAAPPATPPPTGHEAHE